MARGSATPALALLAWPIAVIAVWLAQRAFIADWSDRRLATCARGRGRAGRAVPLPRRARGRHRPGVAVGARARRAWGSIPATRWSAPTCSATPWSSASSWASPSSPSSTPSPRTRCRAFPSTCASASLACGATPVADRHPRHPAGRHVGHLLGGHDRARPRRRRDHDRGDGRRQHAGHGPRTSSTGCARCRPTSWSRCPRRCSDSTLYRMLFLAALTLFAVTFVVNTVAEIVRMRFRKRAFQL